MSTIYHHFSLSFNRSTVSFSRSSITSSNILGGLLLSPSVYPPAYPPSAYPPPAYSCTHQPSLSSISPVYLSSLFTTRQYSVRVYVLGRLRPHPLDAEPLRQEHTVPRRHLHLLDLLPHLSVLQDDAPLQHQDVLVDGVDGVWDGGVRVWWTCVVSACVCGVDG